MISLDLMKSSGIRKAGDRCVIPSNDESTVHVFFLVILILLVQSPAILTSDDFIRSNEIIRTK